MKRLFNYIDGFRARDGNAGNKRASVTNQSTSKRFKNVDPRMASQMGHFSLAKRKNVTPQNTEPSTIGSASALDNVVKELESTFPALIVESCVLGGRRWAIVRGKPSMESSIDLPVYSSRMIITVSAEDTVSFKFEAMFVIIANGVLPADRDRFHELVRSLCPESGYFLCEGIPYEMATLMDFQTKSMRKWDFPFQRLDHKNCDMWMCSTSLTSTTRRCKCCSNLMYYIKREGKKQQAVTAEEKAARVHPSSHFPIKYLSPANQEERRNSIVKEKKALQRQVKKRLTVNDANVDDVTNATTS
ncbi:uncharacterized protein [Dysidea avara]|uniref:uncharacterized protein isoform X2 n=1 Tax=Dysidea avara TaxID=196820 RepID=UPI00331AC3DE